MRCRGWYDDYSQTCTLLSLKKKKLNKQQNRQNLKIANAHINNMKIDNIAFVKLEMQKKWKRTNFNAVTALSSSMDSYGIVSAECSINFLGVIGQICGGKMLKNSSLVVIHVQLMHISNPLTIHLSD